MKNLAMKLLAAALIVGAGVASISLLESRRPGRQGGGGNAPPFPQAGNALGELRVSEPLLFEEPAAPGAPAVTAGPPLELRDLESPAQSVVINEVQYHPAGDDRRDEWLEIINRSSRPADIGGWKLAGAVQLSLAAGTTLKPGECLVLAADAQRLKTSAGISNAIGDWTGELPDGGGKVQLLDAAGREADSLAYDDEEPFSTLPDGLGRSLERRDPHARADFAGNWGPSSTMGWQRVEARGVAPSQRLYFYLDGAGTAYLDDLELRPLDGGPAAARSDFEDESADWTFNGNHAASRITDERSHGGRRSLKISARGAGASQPNSAVVELAGLQPGQAYVLEVWALVPDPAVGLSVRFSRGRSGAGTTQRGLASLAAEVRGGGQSSTPGRMNSLYTKTLPPFVFPVSHSPARPRPGEEVTVTARVSGAGPPSQVLLFYDDGKGERSIPLKPEPAKPEPAKPEPAKPDGPPPGDKTADKPADKTAPAAFETSYSAQLGPFRAPALVIYRVVARGAEGHDGCFPFEGEPTRARGFYIEEREQPSSVPVYHLFMPEAALSELESNPGSDTYRPATFVYDGLVYTDVGARFRGQTSRFMEKKHWKVKFNKDRRFLTPAGRRVRSINLNCSFADKTFLREYLAYNLWRDLGRPYHQIQHVRMSMNGRYHGLYLHLEVPNEDFMDRNRLPAGWLWKSYGEARPGGANTFELEAGDPQTADALLREFLSKVNSLRGPALEKYAGEHMDMDVFLDFLATCQMIHSADHMQKNYLVYAGPDMKFTYLPWDLDLTHGRNYECGEGGIWNDRIRYDMWDSQYRDTQLLFGTRLHPKCDGFWNGVIDAVLSRTEAFRPLYYKRLAEHLAHYYHPDVLIPKIERMREKLRPEVALDRRRWGSYGQNPDFERDCDVLLGWVRNRFRYLSTKLSALGFTVGPALNADFEAATVRGPAPLAVAFRSLSVGQKSTVVWDFGDGATSSEESPTHTYSRPGRFDVKLTLTGPAGSHTAARREMVHVTAR